VDAGYSVTTVMVVWDFDLLDAQSLAKYDNHIYFLDEISKFLHVVLVKTKTGPSITSAFRPIIHDD